MAGLLVGIPLVAAYLVISPPAGDLAAATYRSALFAVHPFATWDTGWYAAHGYWLPGYSLLSPALGALLGVRVLLVLSALGAVALFAPIAERAFGLRSGRAATCVFALGFSVGLLSGRVPYDLGFAIGLGSLLALMCGALPLALALAVLTSVTSPVAGAFLALAGAAVFFSTLSTDRRGASRHSGLDRRHGVALTAVSLVPILALAVAFPDGGFEPFAFSAFWPPLVGVAMIALLLPRGALSERAHLIVRVGAGLYALALIASFALHTPMGGNAARLGPLLAAPIVIGVLWERNRAVGLLFAPVLLYWQLATPLHDYSALAADPSTHSSYYAPLISELHNLRDGAPTIVEVPMTKAHWEAAFLAGHDGVELARGWERQLDERYGSLFYRSPLTAAAYRTWLRENRVAYVALPDAPLDSAGQAEGALIARGMPYLREIWRKNHWRLYRFMG